MAKKGIVRQIADEVARQVFGKPKKKGKRKKVYFDVSNGKLVDEIRQLRKEVFDLKRTRGR